MGKQKEFSFTVGSRKYTTRWSSARTQKLCHLGYITPLRTTCKLFKETKGTLVCQTEASVDKHCDDSPNEQIARIKSFARLMDNYHMFIKATRAKIWEEYKSFEKINK